MKTMRCFAALSLALMLATGTAFPQGSSQPPKEECSKWRTVGAVLGGVGGLLVGGGLVDDDRNPEAFLPVLIISPAAGAVAGYFIGRAIDRRGSSHVRKPDPFAAQESRNRLVEAEVQRWRSRVPNKAVSSGLRDAAPFVFDGRSAVLRGAGAMRAGTGNTLQK